MDDSAVLRFALVSGLIGFAAFGASYTLQVWRRRNAQIARSTGGLAARLRHGSLLLVGGGLLSMAAAAAIRELDRPEGRLLSDGLFSVRVPADDLRVVSVCEGARVKQGEILARLESPFAEARVANWNAASSGWSGSGIRCSWNRSNWTPNWFVGSRTQRPTGTVCRLAGSTSAGP